MIEQAFKVCAEEGIPLVAHCEDAQLNGQYAVCSPSALLRAGMQYVGTEKEKIKLHSQMRPVESEVKAISDALKLVRKYHTNFHVAHLSTKGGLELVRSAKKDGLPVTCEVAPHHLFLTVEDYSTLGTLAKMNPPLRSIDDRDALWAGICEGTVDCISTDHAPHTLEEKRAEDPLKAPSGVPGVETMLPLLLTVSAGKWPHPTSLKPKACNEFSVENIKRCCFENPNRIFNLGKNPEENLISIDTEKSGVITAHELHSKCGWTPDEGWEVLGGC